MLRPILLLAIGSIFTLSIEAKPINICTDNNYWFPFTFMKDDKAAGIHIDVINQALTNLGYEVTFKPVPWKRCLGDAEAGTVDGIATASYKDERAVFMNYPADAKTAKIGEFRVTQVEYAVITGSTDKDNKPQNYQFSGDLKTIPQPVRIPAGYSIVDTMTKAGLTVDAANGSNANFKKLLRDKVGSVVDLPSVAAQLSKDPEFAGKLVVSPTTLESKSYYFPLTKKGSISVEEAQKIWAEIAKVRDDENLMKTFQKKYMD